MAAEPANNLVLCGTGPERRRVATALAGILKWENVASYVADDVEARLEELAAGDFDLLTLNLGRETGLISVAGQAAIETHLAGGGALLVVHTSPECLSDWRAWPTLLGARWNPERSRSSGPDRVAVSVRTSAHPIVAGVGGFEVVDEIFGDLDRDDDLDPLATVAWSGGDQPVLWAREVEGGRLVYDALGSDDDSLSHPAHRILLTRAVTWLLGRSMKRDPDNE